MLKSICLQCKLPSARQLASSATPRICIVGSGPAGFYVAQHLIKHSPSVQVDLYERLPVPFGLVRYGVAPDHPEVKNVVNTFTKTAHNPCVSFYGNVSLGKDISLQELKTAYHAVVLTYGAERDKELGVEGESLEGVLSARRLVGWYNGLPADTTLPVNLNCDTAVVLGQGNVAVDVARILLTHIDVLKKTDISSHAVPVLASSKVRRVVMVGRRGPLQVAFTIKELRELLKLPGVRTEFLQGQTDSLQSLLDGLARPRRRLSELLLKAAVSSTADPSADKALRLLFLRSPISFLGTSHVSAVKLAVTNLQGDTLEHQKAVDTSEREVLPCGLVLRSIGYQSIPADPDVPFDLEHGIVKQTAGVYAAGWLATGPVGVILSTMTNAFSTADIILRHMSSGQVDISETKPGAPHILNLLRSRGVPTVNFSGWERIDRVEVDRGKAVGKPREKIVSTDEMLQIGGSF